jgi:hypothetical protein
MRNETLPYISAWYELAIVPVFGVAESDAPRQAIPFPGRG